MKRRFVISDTHFAHDKIYFFTSPKGGFTRPWAKNSAQADEMMIDAWNNQVRQQDTVYHLGDVSIANKGLTLLKRLNGRKVLIRGNHDIFKIKKYLEAFADVRGTHKYDRLILSHYPIHPDSIPHWCNANVHGHTHTNIVMRTTWLKRKVPDLRYINACVEQIGITPIDIEDLVERAKAHRNIQPRKKASNL